MAWKKPYNFITFFTLMLSGCNGSHLSAPINTIEIKNSDKNITELSIDICDSHISTQGSISILKMDYINTCPSESDISVQVKYNDGETISKAIGYIVGGEKMEHKINIETKRITLQSQLIKTQ